MSMLTLRKLMRVFYCSLFLSTFLLPSFSQETLTLTTYYPAPFGVYDRLVTRTLGVGDMSDVLNGIGADDAPNPSSDPGDVWIAGNVGIGTTEPVVRLDIDGELKVGNSAIGCTADTEGAIRYNSSRKTIEYCDGSAWTIQNLPDIYFDYWVGPSGGFDFQIPAGGREFTFAPGDELGVAVPVKKGDLVKVVFGGIIGRPHSDWGFYSAIRLADGPAVGVLTSGRILTPHSEWEDFYLVNIYLAQDDGVLKFQQGFRKNDYSGTWAKVGNRYAYAQKIGSAVRTTSNPSNW